MNSFTSCSLLLVATACGGAGKPATVTQPETFVTDAPPDPPLPVAPRFLAAGAVPDDTVALAHLDLEAMRGSVHWDRVSGWFDQLIQSGGQRVQEEVDIASLLHVVDEAWVSTSSQFRPRALGDSAPAGECKEGLLVVLRGASLDQVDPQQVVNATVLDLDAVSLGRTEGSAAPQAGEPPRVASLPGHWILGCALDVRLAASRGMEGRPLEERRPELAPLVARARQDTAPLSVWVSGDPEALDAFGELWLIDDPSIRQELQDGAFWLDASADVVMESTATLLRNESAAQVAGHLESQRQAVMGQPFLRLFGLLPVVQAVRVKHEGPLATVRLHMAEQEFQGLLNRLEVFQGLLQQGAQGRDSRGRR